MAPKKPRRGTTLDPQLVVTPKPQIGAASSPAIDLGPIIPLPLPVDPNQNFFDRDRPGTPVVRADDLLVLRIELNNLAVEPGTPPRLKKTAAGAATLTLHFPPQAITEETFFETPPPGVTPPGTVRPPPPQPADPTTSEDPSGPPIRARIAGESRLVFNVPDAFDVPYTLEGVLAAVEQLPLAVKANAKPAGASSPPLLFSELFASQLQVERLSPAQRGALTSFAARSLQIAAVQGDFTTLQVRHGIGGPGLPPLVKLLDKDKLLRPRAGPELALPGPRVTAIELPWRLLLSPSAEQRWRHAKAPVTLPREASAAQQHTELWHSRLLAPDANGNAIEPPQPDPHRSVRAIWALSGENSSKPLTTTFPVADALPNPDNAPFRMPLNDYDRYQIAHLSANFSISNYVPQAIGTQLLMLSALGGWLDSRGTWDPPGLSVEEWVHHATMGRDHYVRVVYKGFLFPFGHRVALVKVSERKFHNGARNADGQPVIGQKAGNTAYLRQRVFLVIRERERRFTDLALKTQDGAIFLNRQLPFTSVRILTTTTPNLDDPATSAILINGSKSQRLFRPSVNGQPFAFQCSATDLDGRAVQFELPMIFMENTLASPRAVQGNRLVPNFDLAEKNALVARAAWLAGPRAAQLNLQRVALAQSVKAGDTSVQAESLTFDAVVENPNTSLRAYSNGLASPVFYPSVSEAGVRIAALAQLTGSAKANRVRWNAHYLANGFATSNQGQVYVDVVSESGMATLDFSTQGDRSGGFVQPNLRPSALSRLSGPVTGNVEQFISGSLSGADAFPKSLSDLPLPLLFGCIPLGDVIQTVSNLADHPGQIPKFVSEASSQLESFINDMARLFDLVSALADQPGRIADAALSAARQTLHDLLEQTQAYADSLVADARTPVNELLARLDDLATEVQQLVNTTVDTAPALPGLPAALAAVQAASANLRTTANQPVAGVALPAGLRQGLLQIAAVLDKLTASIGEILQLLAQGKALFTALEAIVGHPEALSNLLSNPGELKTRLQAVQGALLPIQASLSTSHLLDGAPRQSLLSAIDAVLTVIAGADELLQLLQMLTGEELTLRFDWNPPIDNWALVPGADPLFRANDKHGFLIAVEAKVKKNGQSAPKISVVCSLKSFDLVLIAPASFIELNFEKIQFSVDSAAKMDVDVLLTDIKFVGPLSFVETLRDLIPLDGFSDPPHLDITPQGIDAGFDIALPAVAIGVFNLSNLSLGAGFTVPFIGQPLAVRFNFCTREQPFNLTVTLFGGGGFFGITLDPSGIQILEAALEFGASISINLGVASGGVHVMAGIYFRMETGTCSLTGYLRLGGSVSVLGLITASIELYLALTYEPASGKCAGIAKLTIEVEVFLFSTSVTVTCERKFAGANGDPSFRDLVGLQPELPLEAELALIDDDTSYAWREYAEAFA